jgi:hypothetical protein
MVPINSALLTITSHSSLITTQNPFHGVITEYDCKRYLEGHWIKNWLFADDCIIYRKILNIKDVEKLQTDLDRLGDWAEGNEMKINPNKSKAINFTRGCHRVTTQLQLINKYTYIYIISFPSYILVSFLMAAGFFCFVAKYKKPLFNTKFGVSLCTRSAETSRMKGGFKVLVAYSSLPDSLFSLSW